MKFVLDYNRLYALEAAYADGTWRIRLDLPEAVHLPFAAHLASLITLHDHAGTPHRFAGWQAPLLLTGEHLEVCVDGHVFGRLYLREGKLRVQQRDYLTVSETRLIGEMPEGRGAVHRMRGDGSARGAVFTDMHTHSSSEISGQDLVALAVEKGACYPVRLLKEVGVAPEGLPQQIVPRVWFPPLEPDPAAIESHEAGVPVAVLSDAQQSLLAQAFNVRADRQSTTGEMELDYYRLRYPLAKHPGIFRAMWRRIAESYRVNGIHYAEITISTPSEEQLTLLHEELPRIEKDTGVSLRFLVGMPRTLPRRQLRALIEKAKILSQSPYIVGLDFIGYEVNKTRDFNEELRDLAVWIRDENPEFTLRVHAGENAKNLENVHDVLAVAHAYGVRTRIGHAVYGVQDKATITLAQKLAQAGKLVLEFNIDSNLALNNIDAFYAIPFQDYVRRNIRFLISSDGNGLYQTSAPQLEKGLEHLGLDAEALAFIRLTQHELLVRQHAYSDIKMVRLEQEYAGHDRRVALLAQARALSARCAAVRVEVAEASADRPVLVPAPVGYAMIQPDQWPEPLSQRDPLLLFGASGTSWQRVSAKQQREAAVAVDMLVHMLDPQRVFFVLGRAKNDGLSALLEQALEALRQHPGAPGFYVMSLLTPHAIADPENISVHLNFIQPIENNFVALARRLVEFVKARRGAMIGIGGAAFTRDVILKARHEGVPFYVMSEVQGASKEKAFMLEPLHRAKSALQLIERVYAAHPAWFKEDAMAHQEALYELAQRRVERRLPQSRAPRVDA